jgi:hypothetical protein
VQPVGGLQAALLALKLWHQTARVLTCWRCSMAQASALGVRYVPLVQVTAQLLGSALLVALHDGVQAA